MIHPGKHLLETHIKPSGLTIARTAENMGISRTSLSAVVNGKFGISPMLACKISNMFGGDPIYWLYMQADYDLWEYKQKLDKDSCPN